MESTGSRELIKSILIVVGIPLAFSVVARITDRKTSSMQDQIQETEFDGMCGDTHDVNYLKEQMFALKSKIEELQQLEREIEDRFFRFINLKDQEHALMEVQNNLVMEKERAGFLEREVSSMEVENKKFDEMVIEYLKALEDLESSRLENGFLRRRVKKLLKKTRELSQLMRNKDSKLEAQEAEMARNKAEMIRKFEHEVEETQAMISRLQEERNEVLNKLESAEKAASSKAEAERLLTEKYNQVVNELELLQKDRTAEVKELIYLRWCHACLKHELARRNQVEQERKLDNKTINTDPEECTRPDSDNDSMTHHDETVFGTDGCHSKRRWLVRKFKKWVDGTEKHHDVKCFGSHSVVDEA